MAEVAAADNLLIVNSQTIASHTAPNFSLVKLGTLAQTILGLTITGFVVSATILTITLISVGVGVSAPRAVPDEYTVYKHIETPLYVLSNDNDPKGANLTIVSIEQPMFGKASIFNGRYILYQSYMYYAGNDMVNYTITNGKLTASTTAYINVINNPPFAPDFTFSVRKNSEDVPLDLLTLEQNRLRITDVDNDLLFITAVSTPEFGSVTLNNSIIYYTAPESLSVSESLNYTVSDRNSTSVGTIHIKVVNNPPVAKPISLVVQKNLVQIIDILSHVTDENGDSVSLQSVGPCKAVVNAQVEDGTARYVPLADTNPYTDSFEYTVTDGELTATSYVTIQMLNTVPTAFNNTLIIYKNTASNAVGLGMSDPDILDTLQASLASSVTENGNLSLSLRSSTVQRYFGDNWYDVPVNSYSALYTPFHDFVGSDLIRILVTDGYDNTDAYVHVTVLNQEPVAVDDHFNCSRNIAEKYNLLLNDEDPNGDDIELIDFTELPTEYGGKIVRVNSQEVMYYPPAGFVGVDSVVYTITDIQLLSSNNLKANGTVYFNNFNQDPVAVDDVLVIGRNLVDRVYVLLNDSDPNGDVIRVTQVDTASNAATSIENDEYVVVTAGNDIGQEILKYTINDDLGASAEANIHVDIINNPPVPEDDEFEIIWNRSFEFDLISNDSDKNGDTLSIQAIGTPSNSSINLVNSTHVLFRPDNGFVGQDSFTYTIYDGYDVSVSSATVTVIVIDNAPSASDFSETTHWTVPITIDVLQGASDPDDDPISVADVSDPTHGTVEIIDDGVSQKLKYSPSNHIGPVTFTYRVTDGYLYATGLVTVTVTNTQPEAQPDSLIVHWRADPQTIRVLDNDTDADNDPITVDSFTLPDDFAGTVTKSATNVVYDPNAQRFAGEQTFVYTITDGAQTSESTVTIIQTNEHVPAPGYKEFNIHWKTQSTGTLFQIFSSADPRDGDSDPLTYTVDQPAHGSVQEELVGGITFLKYTQTEDYLGNDIFTYTISDGFATADTLVNFTVRNSAPTCEDFSISRHWDAWYPNGVSINSVIYANAADEDPEDNPYLLSATPSGSIANVGTITVSEDNIEFTPVLGYTGSITLDLVFTDGLESCSSKYTLEVTNEAPVATPTAVEAHWKLALPGITVNLAADTTDADSDIVTYTVVSTTYGTSTISQPGVVRYTQPIVKLITSSITVDYSDGWATRRAVWDVTVYNQLPHVDNQTITLHWRSAQGIYLNFLVGSYDPDPEDEVSLIETDEPPSGATTTILETKLVAYNPLDAFVGTDLIGFVASDGLANVKRYISITLTNTKPVAADDSATMHWAANSVVIRALDNDSDLNQDPISISSVTVPATAVGSTTFTTSTITYTRGVTDPSSIGEFEFYYHITDGAEESLPGYVTVTVTNNDSPNAPSYTTQVHWREFAASGSSFEITSRKTDNDGDSYTATSVTNPELFTVSEDSGASGITYVVTAPDASWKTGNGEITYELTDGIETSTGTISLTVYNNAPVAKDITISAAYATLLKGVYVNVLPEATDEDAPDRPFLTLSDTLDTSALTLGATASVVTYQGTKQIFFKTTESTRGSQVFTYTISDGLESGVGTVNITLDPSMLSDSNLLFSEHWTTTDIIYDLIDGLELGGLDTSAYELIEVTSAPTSGGDVTIFNRTAVTYSHPSDFLGFDDFRVSYTNSEDTKTIAVTVSVTNTLPTVPQVTLRLHRKAVLPNYGVDLVSYASDANDDSLVLTTITRTGGSGSATKTSGTSATYTPSATDFVGRDTFLYTISDGIQSSNNYLVMDIFNNPPTTYRKTITVKWTELLAGKNFKVNYMTGAYTGGTASSQVDSDADGDELTVSTVVSTNSALTITRLTDPEIGVVLSNPLTVNSGKSYTVNYRVTDGSSNGIVDQSVIIQATNTPPKANADTYNNVHWKSTPVYLPVTSNDVDNDGDDFWIDSSSSNYFNSTHIVYQQSTGSQGSRSISYKITDGASVSTGTVTIVIVNSAPVAAALSETVHWRSIPTIGYTFNILNSNPLIYDPDTLDSLTLSLSGSVSGMTPSTTSGNVILKPTKGFVGTATYTYTVSDGLASTSRTVSLTVTNAIPNSQSNVFSRSSSVATGPLDFTPYITDPNNDPIIIEAVSQGSEGGTFSLNSGSMEVTYTQRSGFVGTEKFTITFSDGWAPSVTRDYFVTVGNTGSVSAKTLTVYEHGVCFYVPITDRTDEFKPTTTISGATITVVNSFSGSYGAGSVITTDGVGITICPPAGSLAPFYLVYTVTDGQSIDSDTIQVTLYNTAPTASNKQNNYHFRVATAAPIVISDILSLVQASDADNDALTVTSIVKKSNGVLTITSSNSFTFEPTVTSANSNFNIDVQITDSWATITVRITLRVTNTAPTGTSFIVTKSWRENTFTIDMTGYMSDSNTEDRPFLVVTGNSANTALSSSFATISNGGKAIDVARTVQPSDITTPLTISYKVYDGLSLSSTATITIKFTDTAPTATGDSKTIKWTGTTDFVLGTRCSDSDDPDLVTLTHINGVPVGSFSSSTANMQGTVSLINAATLTVRFTPFASIAYPTSSQPRTYTAQFTFVCSDGLLSTTGVVSVTVTNNAPVAASSTINRNRVAGSNQYTISNFFTPGSTDADGDSISIVNVQNAVLSGNNIIVTMDSSSQIQKSFTYQYYDGQLYSNTGTVTVVLDSQNPACSSRTVTINRGQTSSFNVNDLCSTPNGVSMSFYNPNPSLGSTSVSNGGQTLTFAAPSDRSGSVTFIYTVVDGVQKTATSTITVNVNNRAPTAQPYTWSLSGTRNSNVVTLSTSSYLSLASATDADSYDASRLKVTSVQSGTCTDGTAGQVRLVGSNIQFTRLYTFDSGSCVFEVTISDADQTTANVLTVTAEVTVTVTSQPLVAVGRTYSVADGNTVFQLSAADITVNDYDPMGGSFEFVGFFESTEYCTQLGFCRVTPQQNGNRWIFTAKSENCQIDRYAYKIRSIQNPSVEAIGIFNVEYTSCRCLVPMDAVLVFDSSSSVGSSNFQLMRQFATSLVNNFVFADEGSDPNANVAMGVVRFSDQNLLQPVSSITTSKTQLTSAINSMAYVGGSTYILDALRLAEKMLTEQGRPQVQNKVIVMIFDGEPNGPCSCSECRTRYGAPSLTTGVYNTAQEQEEQCKSVRYPYRTCNSCDLYFNYNLKCMPCSDIVPLCQDINSRKPKNAGDKYWRIIPVGIGQALSNAVAQQLLKDMSYDPTRSFYVQWDQLTALFDTVSSQTCNLVDISDASGPKTHEYAEPKSFFCGDIISIRASSNYLRYSTVNNVATLSNEMQTEPNTPGIDRGGLWQIVCPGQGYGTNVTYGTNVALWNLQTKTFAKRSTSNDEAAPTLTGTLSEVNSQLPQVLWKLASVGVTTSGKVYNDNTVCFGSTTTSKFLYATYFASNVNPGTTATACSNVDQALFPASYRWRNLNNKNGISFTDFPTPLPSSENV